MSIKVTLNEAATFLGVSKSTLRNWDNEGKLTAIRNPINGYRLYDMDELLALKSITGEIPNKMSDNFKLVDNKATKRIINKLNNIIRDSDANSNIITRFDEISKLLFIKIYTSNYNEDLFKRGQSENLHDYYEKIQNAYNVSVDKAEIDVPSSFSTIGLDEQTLYKCGQELNEIDFSDVDYDIKGLAYEDVIKGTFDKNDNQQFFTPYQIVDFIVQMTEPYLKGNVCDPACGTAGFLISVSKKKPGIHLYGVEVDERLAWVSRLNLLLHGQNKFDIACLSNGGSLGVYAEQYFNTFNAILTNPPFGSDYTDEKLLSNFELGKNRTSRRRGILFIEQAWNFLKEKGVVAIVIDESVLNSVSNHDVREYILDHFRILAIVELPDTAFKPYASVNSSILFLQKVNKKVSQNRVFYAKSSSIGRKANGDDDYMYDVNGKAILNSDLPEIVEKWKLFQDGNFEQNDSCFIANVSKNIGDDKNFRLDYSYHHPVRKESQKILSQSKYPLLSLSEICIERNESYVPSADTNATTILFTGLADIESMNGVVKQIETPAASLKSSVKRYEPGDIVFSKMRPTLRKIAFMNFENGGYVSSECSVYTVRKDSQGDYIMDPELLSIILRSDFMFGQIIGNITGNGRPRISAKDLRRIMIPVPPLRVQRNEMDLYKSKQFAVEQLRKEAQRLMDKVSDMEKSSINELVKHFSGDDND